MRSALAFQQATIVEKQQLVFEKDVLEGLHQTPKRLYSKYFYDAKGALEAARKDNSRLQSEVAALRSALRRGTPIEETPLTPTEPANEDAPARKVKNAAGAEPADKA